MDNLWFYCMVLGSVNPKKTVLIARARVWTRVGPRNHVDGECTLAPSGECN